MNLRQRLRLEKRRAKLAAARAVEGLVRRRKRDAIRAAFRRGNIHSDPSC